MTDAAERLEDESLGAREAAVDDAIRAAGGDPRAAVWALLVQLAEREEARALAHSRISLGYRRGRQPLRKLP
ncbi:hypothetical protein [Hansschlegelia beijingensis]|uniref:Uncharacterized protein n=1 Tax=Hansschlegelia beijingensis TaxID=1133344 RepID=A0A7W6GDH7_9HYPH|nr:hypothetical protein [Hansschlegelia beijingensis]MBB3971836.1 hypothetical protein [Hansschlegelia beijingensis]